MSDFRWIALALTVTAACQVYDRVPWGRCWGWLTAKALALRSWTFEEGYQAAVIDADDWHSVEFVPSRYDAAEPAPTHVAPPDSGEIFRRPPRRRPSRRKKVKP